MAHLYKKLKSIIKTKTISIYNLFFKKKIEVLVHNSQANIK